MRLALFDLDHTLIPFDSGMAWTQFLVSAGVLPPSAESEYLGYCRQYIDGTLDIHAMHRATVAPLARFPRPLIAQWGREFELRVAERVPEAMRALVQQHLDAGDLCAIVTATTRFVAEPFSRLFGVPNLLATEAATADGAPDGSLTGEIAGLPCFREHKRERVVQWLAERTPTALAEFERSWFYSDSASDLPLLQAVSDPVAVRPDAKLLSHAHQAGWRVLD
jgi:HAD superfamily hydrolase (TIGR01490 family)